ncbi:MAG: hypothetical protein P1P93_00990 [Gammaproteobacteria bacterium]|nr:hypothetical protein [Gammaproteobacteria bacterium]
MKTIISNMFVSLLLLVCWQMTAAANAADEQVKSIVPVSVDMRDHGYMLGDFISMQIRFTLPEPLVLDPLSVPLKGPINAWIDLHDIKVKQQKSSEGIDYEITYVWQVFSTVEKAQYIKLPQIVLQTLPIVSKPSQMEKPAYIFPAEQMIYLSPVLPELITDEKPKPLFYPPKFDDVTPFWLTIISLLLAIGLVIFWLWLHDKVTVWPRNPGPITQLLRQLSKRTLKTEFSLEDLHLINKALAASAKQSLYPDTLTRLYQHAPYLAEFSNEIELFFERSWRAAYVDALACKVISVKDTLSWIRHAGIKERLYRHRCRSQHHG